MRIVVPEDPLMLSSDSLLSEHKDLHKRKLWWDMDLFHEVIHQGSKRSIPDQAKRIPLLEEKAILLMINENQWKELTILKKRGKGREDTSASSFRLRSDARNISKPP